MLDMQSAMERFFFTPGSTNSGWMMLPILTSPSEVGHKGMIKSRLPSWTENCTVFHQTYSSPCPALLFLPSYLVLLLRPQSIQTHFSFSGNILVTFTDEFSCPEPCGPLTFPQRYLMKCHSHRTLTPSSLYASSWNLSILK